MKTHSTNWQDFSAQQLNGRNRRLLHEWIQLDQTFAKRDKIKYQIIKRNMQGLPTAYLITYHIFSISGVKYLEQLNEPDILNPPLFASTFFMRITLPENYPCVDAPAEFYFLTCDKEGHPLPHPWHPNIRYFGDFAGRVCLNTPDSYSSLAWCVERIGHYLSYDRYHATPEPPYPEDLKVAEWVIKQGEPQGWIYFNQQPSLK